MPKTPVKYPESISASVSEGTRDKLDAVRGLKTRGEMIREIVEQYLDAREENTDEDQARMVAAKLGAKVWPKIPYHREELDNYSDDQGD